MAAVVRFTSARPLEPTRKVPAVIFQPSLRTHQSSYTASGSPRRFRTCRRTRVPVEDVARTARAVAPRAAGEPDRAAWKVSELPLVRVLAGSTSTAAVIAAATTAPA